MTIDSGNGYALVSALFLRLLGLIYFFAFASIAIQIEGLAGSEGILPFADKLALAQSRLGIEAYFRLPTLFWLNASDAALTGAAFAGAAAAVLIAFNQVSRLALIAAFVLYLSLYHAGQPFMNFQWDGLLLEAGFLAIFLTPRSRLMVWLFRWLLFRLRFMSGLSKLTMGDPSWPNLTALQHYFEVQPLPTPWAWHFHQLPDWLLRTGTASTLFVELLVPFMMFLPRPWRFLAAWLTILWQVLIILTSNHNWFNFLTIALCLFLFDDRALRRWLPKRFVVTMTPSSGLMVGSLLRGVLAAGILLISAAHFWELSTVRPLQNRIGPLLDYAETYRVVNKYHVFPTMKTQRIELEIQGSVQGEKWRTYGFRYKPSDLDRVPAIMMPHQPRLDWQMWFVTLHPIHLPWFQHFLQGLLNNTPRVTGLLAHNPFPAAPPRYLRVNAYRYRYTTVQERKETGQWWKRESLGPFAPLPWIERDTQPAVLRP